MANLYDYRTNAILAPISEATERLCGALADAANESPEGIVLARKTVAGWDYVRPDEKRDGDVAVFCE